MRDGREPLTLKYDRQHRIFFKSTEEYVKNGNTGHCHFLKLTGDIGDPPSMAPGRAWREGREGRPDLGGVVGLGERAEERGTIFRGCHGLERGQGREARPGRAGRAWREGQGYI